jgi:hypothetical protein
MIVLVSFVLMMLGVFIWQFLGVSAQSFEAHIFIFFTVMILAMLISYIAMTTKFQQLGPLLQ